MKKIILLFLLVISSYYIFAQQNQTDLIETDTSKTIYKNLKIQKYYPLKKMDNSQYKYDLSVCKPCIMMIYDKNNTLISKSIDYTDAPVGHSIYYHPNGKVKCIQFYKEIMNIHRKSGSSISPYVAIRHGSWSYHDTSGKLLYKEYWKDDYFIKQLPEQKKAEAWKVDVYFQGEKLENLVYKSLYFNDTTKIFTNEDIRSFQFVPKFKNKYTSKNFEICCSTSSINEKTYTLDNFKNINIHNFILDKSHALDKEVYLAITILFENQVISSYSIRIR